MSDIYTQTLDALTAPDQTFAFKEELHSSGVTYREFTNIPKTLANFFEYGLMFPEWEFVVLREKDTHIKIFITKLRKQPMLL